LKRRLDAQADRRNDARVDRLGILLSGSTAKAGGNRLYRTMQVLEESPAVSFILDSEHKFIYNNPAWDSFAQSNGAPYLAGEPIIGSNLFDSIPNVLRAVYSNAFREVVKSGRVWEKSYICASPDQFRKYRMMIYFLERRNWFLVTNSLVVEQSHRNTQSPNQYLYFNQGIITMCAHCRCSRRVDRPEEWDFVPEYLRLKGLDALNVSQGLCPICQAYYYPDLSTISTN
jgi:hypothetical protein